VLTKLTLTIDKDVIEKAKAYAQGKNKSVSRIVEEYLSNVSQQEVRDVPLKDLPSPITDKLVGMFADAGEDYKTLLDGARAERLR
jgi:hypothetical protein